jgi:hypothetical protein
MWLSLKKNFKWHFISFTLITAVLFIFFPSLKERFTILIFLLGSAFYWYLSFWMTRLLLGESPFRRTTGRIVILLKKSTRKGFLRKPEQAFWQSRYDHCLRINDEQNKNLLKSFTVVFLFLFRPTLLIFDTLVAVHFIGLKVVFCVLAHVVLQCVWTVIDHKKTVIC